jgi:hypothetical protein
MSAIWFSVPIRASVWSIRWGALAGPPVWRPRRYVGGGELAAAVLQGAGDRRAIVRDNTVDLAPQSVGGLLELGHLVATEGVRVGERSLDGLIAAGGQVVEVAGVGGEESCGVVVDRPLWSVEEGLDLVDHVVLRFEEVVAEVEVVEVPIVGLLPTACSSRPIGPLSCSTNG